MKNTSINLEEFREKRFGRWIVLFIDTEQYPPHKALADCLCDCGTVKKVPVSALKRGISKSCGCLQAEVAARNFVTALTKHGKTNTPEYVVWCCIKCRCNNERSRTYKDYGGRGIKVCERWQNSFQNFLEDMGARPSPKHEIDRIDNDGNYEPSNCRWATKTENARNKRSSMRITIGVETRCLAEWLENHGMVRSTFERRVRRGMTPEEALTKPVRPKKPKGSKP